MNLRQMPGRRYVWELETRIYQADQSHAVASATQAEIRQEFPKKTVERRNTGYAVDLLLETKPFTRGHRRF